MGDIEHEPKDVVEEIREETWVCETHGVVSREELSLSVSGRLLCESCLVATIGRPNADIDTTVTRQEFADTTEIDVEATEVTHSNELPES